MENNSKKIEGFETVNRGRSVRKGRKEIMKTKTTVTMAKITLDDRNVNRRTTNCGDLS